MCESSVASRTCMVYANIWLQNPPLSCHYIFTTHFLSVNMNGGCMCGVCVCGVCRCIGGRGWLKKMLSALPALCCHGLEGYCGCMEVYVVPFIEILDCLLVILCVF